MNPKYALEHWGIWFEQALEALSWLHAQGHSHGFLDAASLRVDGCLKLWVRPRLTESQECFDPKHSIYPPEILLKLALDDGLSVSTAYDLLESKNPSLELCETQLDLDYSFRTFQILWKRIDIQDSYKADVWMLGNTFLKLYLEFLTWPGSVATTFYCHDHERFMNCLGRMLEAYPAKRISAEAAFHTWSPPMLLYPDDAESDDHANSGLAETESPHLAAVAVAVAAAETACETTTDAAETAGVAAAVAAPVAETTVPPKPRRLVLNGYRDPVARNKTRRNPHNSNRNPAIHNPVMHTQD